MNNNKPIGDTLPDAPQSAWQRLQDAIAWYEAIEVIRIEIDDEDEQDGERFDGLS